MLNRWSIVVAAALFGRIALADAPAADRWRVEAKPWKSGLPAVQITLGYPGQYIPSRNSPIQMSATASGSAFDGYIGFRFGVGRTRSREIPVLARATIGRGRTWRFETFAQVRSLYGGEANDGELGNREVLVQWYDASRRLVAQKNVGRAPWSSIRPLYVAASPDAPTPPDYDKTAPVVLKPSDLGSTAQWFNGFSALIIRVDDWLDLPINVRQMAFHSNIPIVSIGVPRPAQQFTDIDRAVIPVEFTATPSVMEIPWIYGSSEQRRTMPMSWRARDPERASSPTSPYFAVEPSVSWVAEMAALSQPLPAMAQRQISPWYSAEQPKSFRTLLPFVVTAASQFRAVIAVLISVLCSILIWVLLRKRATALALLTCAAAVVAIVGMRSAVRRTEGTAMLDVRTYMSATALRRRVSHRSFGPSPLAAVPVVDAATWTGRVADDTGEEGEIRTSETLPGHGIFVIRSAWDQGGRIRFRREVAPATTTRIVELDESKMTIDLDGQIPAAFVYALWIGQSGRHGGLIRVPPGATRVTVRSGDMVPYQLTSQVWDYWDWDYDVRPPDVAKARVTFESDRGPIHTTTTLLLPVPSPLAYIPYRTGSTSARQRADGWNESTFKLASMRVPADAFLRVSITSPAGKDLRPVAASVEGCRGTSDLSARVKPQRDAPYGSWAFDLPYASVASIACNDNLLRIAFKTDIPGDAMKVSLSVRTKGTHE